MLLHGWLVIMSSATSFEAARAVIVVEDATRADAAAERVCAEEMTIGPHRTGSETRVRFEIEVPERAGLSIRAHISTTSAQEVQRGDLVSTVHTRADPERDVVIRVEEVR